MIQLACTLANMSFNTIYDDVHNGVNLTTLVQRHSSDPEELLECLMSAKRWSDIRRLLVSEDEGIRKAAEFEWAIHTTIVRSNAVQDQSDAALPSYLQSINRIFSKIHLGHIHYPHKSHNQPASNLCFTIEGMGVAYFHYEHASIELIAISDPHLQEIFDYRGLAPGDIVEHMELAAIMVEFVDKCNDKTPS